jgi:hypothetical protein
MSDAETIALRKTVIGGKSYADDFTMIWRGLRIMSQHTCEASCQASSARGKSTTWSFAYRP